MPNPAPVGKLSGVYGFRWWCPGCERFHIIPTKPLAPNRPDAWVGAPDGWEFNGDYVHPTISPSVLVYSHSTFINKALEGDALTAPENVRETFRCHSFIREGQIEFLVDCTHPLAGRIVDMEAVDDPRHYDELGEF